MKFKVGDKVRIIKRCDCRWAVNCSCCNGNPEGVIQELDEENPGEWTILISKESNKCHFKEKQLEMIEKFTKNIKQFGIVNFCKENYK